MLEYYLYKQSKFHIFFGVVGVLMLAGGFWYGAKVAGFVSHALTAQGTVIGYESHRSDGKTMYAPVVRFSDEAGAAHEFTSGVSSSSKSGDEGAKIEVLYEKGNPEHAQVGGATGTWGGVGIIALLGVGFTAIGVLMEMQRQKRKALAQRLTSFGKAQKGTVKSFEEGRTETNKRRWQVIIALGEDGKMYRSVELPQEVAWRLTVGAQTSIVVDPADPNVYLVDVPTGITMPSMPQMPPSQPSIGA